MGCNNSRLNANGEVVPARIRPLLLHGIEELRKHRNGSNLRGEGTLSKKQLLKGDAAKEDEDYQSSNEDENEHKISSKETQQSQQTVVRVVTVEKLSKVVPLPASEYGTEEQHNKHKDHNPEKVKDVGNKDKVDLVTDNEECAYCVWPLPENKHEEANAKYNDDHDDHNNSDEKDNDDDDDDEEEDEEEGEEDDENGRFLGPGSPSFRIYVEAEKTKEEQHENQTIVVHQKSISADSFESAASASGNSRNSNEVVEIESATKRKGHKLKKLGAVKKNLLKVKNIQVKHRMNPMFSCAGNERKSLLSPK